MEIICRNLSVRIKKYKNTLKDNVLGAIFKNLILVQLKDMF